MCYKVLIWGCGGTYNHYSAGIFREVRENRIEIVGFIGSDTTKSSVDGYPFIEKERIREIEFDYIIAAVTEHALIDIYHEAVQYGISRDKFIRADVLVLPGFDFAKYIKLRGFPVSIISYNCFGGMVYHKLDLPFASPTINLYFSSEGFIRFCCDLPRYLSTPLTMGRMRYEKGKQFEYPIAYLEDVEIYFSHYPTFGEAQEKWNRRKEKINLSNILVVMWADKPEQLKGFSNIPYRKICFTSFKTEERDTCYIPLESGEPLWKVINESALGTYPYFDLLKLMLGEPGFMRCEFK